MKPRSRSVPVPGKLRSKGRKPSGAEVAAGIQGIAVGYARGLREGEIKGLLRAARYHEARSGGVRPDDDGADTADVTHAASASHFRSEASRLRKVGR